MPRFPAAKIFAAVSTRGGASSLCAELYSTIFCDTCILLPQPLKFLPTYQSYGRDPMARRDPEFTLAATVSKIPAAAFSRFSLSASARFALHFGVPSAGGASTI